MTDTQLLDAQDRRDIVAALDFMADNGCLTEECRTRCRELIVKVLATSTEPPPDHEAYRRECYGVDHD